MRHSDHLDSQSLRLLHAALFGVFAVFVLMPNMNAYRMGESMRWAMRMVLLCGCLTALGCTAEGPSAQSRDEATKAGRTAYKAGDYEAAFEEFHSIAQTGDPLSQFYLARMYQFGEGRNRDIDRAIYWYERAAKAGAAPAQYHLGRIYDVEPGYRDLERAIKWYSQAADREHADAMHSLGYVYAKKGNLERAFKWTKRAADVGSAAAQFDVGLKYENGTGIPANPDMAHVYYNRSARQGYGDAMINLAFMHSEGKGTERNLRQVYKWFVLANEQGIERAQHEVTRLENLLDDEALRVGREMASAWRRTHLDKHGANR